MRSFPTHVDCDLMYGIANVVQTQYVHQTHQRVRQALATDHNHCATDVDTLYFLNIDLHHLGCKPIQRFPPRRSERYGSVLEKYTFLLLTDFAGRHVAVASAPPLRDVKGTVLNWKSIHFYC